MCHFLPMSNSIHSTPNLTPKILVIGAGLAGVEAAYFLANKNYQVVIVEGKKIQPTSAQSLENFAELVCTNSLKSIKPDSAHGLLKIDMEKLNSLMLRIAMQENIRVPAGDALAVDRVKFAKEMEQAIRSHSNITVVEAVVIDPQEFAKQYNCEYIIICTGPLTLPGLTTWIVDNICVPIHEDKTKTDLYFYDAIAPIVDADSLNYDILYYKDRHKDLDNTSAPVADYLNAPFTKEQYLNFVQALAQATFVPPKDFEKEIFFENCLPVDVLAKRGVDTLRFSCMKPIGLEDPRTNKYPYAVVQLRKENLLGDALNLVGFQSRLTYGEQKRVFRMIPGLENAEFLHYGSVHRNTFLHAKNVLNWDLSSKVNNKIYFAGQMVGVEGYTESAMCGLYVAYMLDKKIKENLQESPKPWPISMATGALIHHIMTMPHPRPTNINMGLMPVPAPDSIPKKIDRKKFKRDFIVNNAMKAWQTGEISC